MTTPTLQDAEQYVLRDFAYIEGVFDCASLAVLVQRELFGREIALPAAGQRSRGRRGQARDIQNFQPELADRVGAPATGDAVIMWETTAHGEPPLNRRWHVGTVFMQAGEVWVLHCANESQGVKLERLSHMLDGSMHLDAFYAWREPAAKTIDLNIVAHPVGGMGAPIEHRQTLAGRTIAQTLEAEGITGGAWIVTVSGYSVPEAMWSRTWVKPGQLIVARARLNKQVLSIVAIAALSYFTAGIAAGTYGGLAAGSAAAIGASTAVYVGGSMLISKLLSPKASSAGDNSANDPPPTYALSGGRNRARQWEPLSLVFGETKVVPDLASQPLTWFDGDDQYLLQTFHAGINCASFEQISNGDTPFSSYEGVTITKYDFPGTPPSGQYPPLGNSVDTIEGGLLDAPTAPGVWVQRRTSVGTSRAQVDLEMQLTYLTEKGNYQQVNVQVEFQYRAVGSTDWLPMLNQVFTNASGKPVRRTLTFDFPVAGQYDVRGRKFADANYTSATGPTNVVSWTSLKSYQPDNADYGSQPRIVIQIRASGQLSGTLDEVNGIARGAPIPLWNGTQWVTVTEPGAAGISNPGAIILQYLRGFYRASDGKRIAGVGLADTRIDMASIQAFMVRCAAKGFRFDGVIQEAMNHQDLLESIAAVGLGSLSRHSGKVGIVWNAEDEPISGVINMGTMKVRSFSVAYDLMQTADEYSLEFFNRDANWTWQPVRVVAPGTGTPQRTSSENVRGVTTATHAAIMARFAMAQNIYGRKTITFEMDLEHLSVRRGSVVALSHDLTQWGYSGRIVQVIVTAGQFIVEIDEPIPASGPATGTIGLRLSGETQMRTFNVASMSADRRQLRVAQSWPSSASVPGVGAPARDALWIYDNKSTPGYKVRIVSIEPSDGMAGAQVTAVPEGPEFWNYVLNGDYTPPPDNSLLARGLPVASNLRISRARVKVGDGFAHELTAIFDVSGPYDHAQLWAAPAGAPLVQVGQEFFGTSVSWVVQQDQSWTVQIRPFDGLGRAGTFVTDTFVDPSEQVVGVSGFYVQIEDAGAVAHWTLPQGLGAIGLAVTQIRSGASWETGVVVWEGRADRALLGWLAAGTQRFWAAHRNTAFDWSIPVSFAIQILPPSQPVVGGRAIRDQVELNWPDCTTTQPIDFYEVKIGPIYASAGLATKTPALGYVRTETTAAKRLYWVTAFDLGGNAGASGYKEIETLPSIDDALEQLQDGFDQQIEDIRALAMQSGFIRANLQYNGGFEQAKDGWITTDVDGFDIGTEYWGVYAVIKTPQATGQISGRPVKALPGQRFTASADIAFLSPTGEAAISLQFKNAAGDIIQGFGGTALQNSDFSDNVVRRESLAVEGLAPAGTVSVTFVMSWVNYSGTGAIGLRYVKIELGARPSTIYTTETTDYYVGSAVRQVTQVSDQTLAKLNASYTLLVTAGRRIAGLRAYADESASLLTFFADKVAFAIGDLDTPKYLLTLGMVNGTPSIGVSGNFYLDGEFKGRMIGAEQITGIHIIADTLETKHHKAGSITADLINVGVGTNLVPNATLTERPGAQGVPTGWTIYENVLGATFGTNFSALYTLQSGVSGYIEQPGASYAGFPFYDRNAQMMSPEFPVSPSTRYEFHARLIAHRCMATVLIMFLDYAGAVIKTEAPAPANRPTGSGQSLGDYAKVGGFSISPANAARARVIVIKGATAVGASPGTSYLFWTQPFAAEATAYQTVLSPYSPSGLGTKITPQGISTPSLSALSADLGAVNAGQVTLTGDTTSGTGYGFLRSNTDKWFDGLPGFILANGKNGDRFIDMVTGGFRFAMRSGPIETTAFMEWGGIYFDNTGQLLIRKAGVVSTPNIVGGAVSAYGYAEFGDGYTFRTEGAATAEIGIFNLTAADGFIVFDITGIASVTNAGETGGGDA